MLHLDLPLFQANVRNAPTPPPVPTTVSIAVETKANPYASSAAASPKDTIFEGAPRERTGRSFRFNVKGKYIQLGNQMRQEIQLEQLKQRIAESAEKAGLDSVFEGLEKNIKVRSDPSAGCQYSSLCRSVSRRLLRNGGMPHYSPRRITMTSSSWGLNSSIYKPLTLP
jgi:hypothetical protein